MGRSKQAKLVTAARCMGRLIVMFIAAQGVAVVFALGMMTVAGSGRAAPAQQPTKPLAACVLPKKWHHMCMTPEAKATWQKKHHCTFCAVTTSDLTTALPHASPEMIDTIYNDLNGNMVEYGLDSPARLLHFFNQVAAETSGGSPKWLAESLNYSVDRLSGLRYFKSHQAKACEYGKLSKDDTKAIRKCKSLDPKGKHPEWWTPHAANQRMIADIWYDGSQGNGKLPSDDGWNYRGRGLLQITHKNTYAQMTKWYNDAYGPKPPVDFVKKPDLLTQPDYAFKASVAFWLQNKIETKADEEHFSGSCAASDAVTIKVNGGGATRKTKSDRCAAFKKLWQGGAFGEVNCHLPAPRGTPLPPQPPGVPLPPGPPVPPLPPQKGPPGSGQPPVGVAAKRAQPAPSSGGR